MGDPSRPPLDHRTLRSARVGFQALMVFVALIAPSCDKNPEGVCPVIQMTDMTREMGLYRYSPTFGVAVTDLDRDGVEDLVISNHGHLPAVFLHRGGAFSDASHLLSGYGISDRHGVAAIDLDNDGDRDLVFAGGGADGIGEGSANQVFRNRLIEGGVLAFEDVTGVSGIACRTWRTRHLLPVPSPGGGRVDLYMACLPRPDHTNLYLSNRGGGEIGFDVAEGSALNRPFSSYGRDGVFDYDRDGDPDILMLLYGVPVMFENTPDGYVRRDDLFAGVDGVFSLAVGDLDNDGDLDLCFGGDSPPSGSDNLCHNHEELHFVVLKQEADPADGMTFVVSSSTIAINFIQHMPQGTIIDPGNIYVGRDSFNPPAREAILAAEDAEGEPTMTVPGIYLWSEPGVNRWHVTWVYGSEDRVDKGRISAPGMTQVQPIELESYPQPEAVDRIWENRKHQGFVETGRWSHHGVTRSVAVCDLNNDGWLDIVGIRGSENGSPNGTPFLLANCQGDGFEFREIMRNDEDDIFQADLLVWGFFDGDGLPDLFFTNGFGLNPDHIGPYKLFLNTSTPSGNYIILELEGNPANRDALGAEVELWSSDGDLLGYRQLGAGYNRAQSTHRLHFGLGNRTDPLVCVRWPGTTEWLEYPVTLNGITSIDQ